MVALRWTLMLAVTVGPGLALAPALRRALGGRAGLAALLGVSACPILVSTAFFALRLAGLGVDATFTAILVAGGAGGLYGLWRLRDALPRAGAPALRVLLVALPTLAFAVYAFADPQRRADQGHVFMHADVVHAFLGGAIWPEEPILAGLRSGYPFFPYPYQALVTWALDQPPVLTYVWSNLVTLLVLLGLSDRLLAGLGVGPRGRVLGGLWLCFGTNPHGWALLQTLPEALLDLDVWGDRRYTPWMQKYLQSNHMTLVYPPLLGLLAVATLPQEGLRKRAVFAVLLGLGLVAGLSYPVLYGVAAAAIGCVGVALFWARRSEGLKAALRDPIVLAVGGVVISVVMVGYLGLLGVDRERSAMQRTPLRDVARKAVELVNVMAPMLLTLWLYRRRRWQLTPSQGIVLLGTAAAAGLAYLVVWLPSYRNEYKFVYGVAMGLFPFLPLLADRALAAMSPGRAAGALALVGAVLVAPAVHWQSDRRDLAADRLLPLATSGVTTRAVSDPKEGYAEAFAAIRARTPPDAVIVAGYLEHYAPTYTQRSLLVPPPERQMLFGYNWPLMAQMGTRGYPWSVMKRREAALQAFFFADAVDPSALPVFTELDRAAVLLVDKGRFPRTAAWLEAEGPGERVHDGDHLLVWLIPTQNM